MTWARWYRFRDNVQANMWLIPTLYALAALALGRFVPRWDGKPPRLTGRASGPLIPLGAESHRQ